MDCSSHGKRRVCLKPSVARQARHFGAVLVDGRASPWSWKNSQFYLMLTLRHFFGVFFVSCAVLRSRVRETGVR